MMTPQEIARLRRVENDKTITLADIDGWIARVEVERAELLDIRSEIHESAPEIRKGEMKPGTIIQLRQQREAAQEDLMALVDGVHRHGGATNPRLAARMGQPGLAALDQAMVRLQRVRDRHLSHMTLWGDGGTRPHRYTGKSGKCRIGGRFLAAGDVVELTESQAKAFRDRFEMVEKSPEPVAEPEPIAD